MEPPSEFRRQTIDSLASKGNRLSPEARIYHAQSLAPARIPLPPLRFGAELLERWPIHEEPQPISWRNDSYECVTPALFIIRDAIIHGSSGLVTIGPDIVEETLAGTDPFQTQALISERTVTLPSSPIERLPGTHITLLAGSQTNFFHAMLDSLARVATIPAHLLAQAATVLLPALGEVQHKLFPHLQQDANLAVRTVKDGESLQIETLILPMTVYGTSSYHPVVRDFFDRLSANIADGAEQFPKRIYLDRRGAPSRRLLNETEIISALRRSGFVPIAAERLSLPDQARLFRGAEAIVAPHGAGLTNIGFCRPGCKMPKPSGPTRLQMDCKWTPTSTGAFATWPP